MLHHILQDMVYNFDTHLKVYCNRRGLSTIECRYSKMRICPSRYRKMWFKNLQSCNIILQVFWSILPQKPTGFLLCRHSSRNCFLAHHAQENAFIYQLAGSIQDTPARTMVNQNRKIISTLHRQIETSLPMLNLPAQQTNRDESIQP